MYNARNTNKAQGIISILLKDKAPLLLYSSQEQSIALFHKICTNTKHSIDIKANINNIHYPPLHKLRLHQ